MHVHVTPILLHLAVILMFGWGVVPAFAETHRYIPKKQELRYTFATAAPVLHLKPAAKDLP